MSRRLFDDFADRRERPWDYQDDDLERQRATQAGERLQAVVSEERVRFTRCVVSESRETDRKTAVEHGFALKIRKETVRLTIEVEWDEWHDNLAEWERYRQRFEHISEQADNETSQ